MRVTEIVSDCRWRHHLTRRRRNYSLFSIPRPLVQNLSVRDHTKRKVRIYLSDGRKLTGYCTISSGQELLIPKWLRKELRTSDWFECELVGQDTATIGGLKWEQADLPPHRSTLQDRMSNSPCPGAQGRA